MSVEYENFGSLITIKGTNQCLGYLFNFRGRGVYSPDGKVAISEEHVDAHNKALSKAEIDGLERCEIGQYGTLYRHDTNGVTTFVGEVVAPYELNGNTITFRRNGKVFRGRLQKDADCFNFRRVK